MADQSGVSVVLITRNESKRIRQCLDSIRWADELIVVDQNSTDGTPDICRQYGAKLFSREMELGFGEQKNFAIAQASMPWILSLDADEVVTSNLCLAIQTAIAAPGEYGGFRIPRLTWYLGRPIRHCGWYPSPVVRLFRRGHGRFTDDLVHEKLLVDGPIGDLREDLLHYSYDTLSKHLQKLDLYTTYDAQMLARRGIRITTVNSLWYLVGKPLAVFFRKYALQLGVLEGWHGMILSAMAAVVVFINYAKLWEFTRDRR